MAKTKFAYEATGADGVAVRGKLKTKNLGEARNLLLQRGIDSAEIDVVKSKLNIEIAAERVPRVELMHFSRQLAAFVRAGIPILEGVHILEEGTENTTMRRTLHRIAERVSAGDTLRAALAEHPKIFPPFYLGMIESAELTGQLDDVLDRLSVYIERDVEAKRKIKSALAYPMVIAGMSLVTVLVLTVFVLPRFRTFFKSLNAKLPLPTRALLWFSGFLGDWWFVFVGVAILLTTALLVARRRPKGREVIDTVLLRLPLIGETVRYAVIERFCRALAAMVHAGVPLPEAMVVATDSANNAVYRVALLGARDAMLRGEGIALPIARTNLFPVAASQMMRVGEETGSLDSQLGVTADFFEQELDYKVKQMTTLFEPAVIILMGLVVGFVAIALVSAMYGIFRQSSQFS